MRGFEDQVGSQVLALQQNQQNTKAFSHLSLVLEGRVGRGKGGRGGWGGQLSKLLLHYKKEIISKSV